MYRCVAELCGKGFPRKVNFCPFCGTRQGAAPAGRRADSGVGAKGDGRAEAARAAASAADVAAAGNDVRSGGQSRAGTADASGRPAAAPAEQPAAAPSVTPSATPGGPATARPAAYAAADAAAKAAQAEADAKANADAKAQLDQARAEALRQARDIGAGGNGNGGARAPEALTPEQQAAMERLNKLKGIPAAAKPAGNAFQPKTGDAKPSPPPLRKPIGKSTWVSVAILLGLIWFLARPSDPTKKLQARVDKAVEQAQECKIDAARAEYTSLKTDKASADQLKYLQGVISANAKACDTKRHRAKAWSDLRPQLESALQGGSIDLADRRLAAFTKTWGADDETRDMDGRIDVRKGERLLNDADACIRRADRNCAESKLQAAEKLQRKELKPRIEVLREALSQLLTRTVLDQHEAAPTATPVTAAPTARTNPPAAAVPPAQPAARTPQAQPAPPAQSSQPAQPSAQSQQARKLLAEAERELRQGNYKGAMDKANICATMIDEGNRECTAMKNRAERMNRDLMNCVAAGREWIDDRCQ